MVSRGMWVLAMILLGYGSTYIGLRVWEKVDRIFCDSNWKYLHQRLLPAIHQFYEPEQ